MLMDEERPMAPEPEDPLEAVFAAEDAAILDDGFSQRVMDRSEQSYRWRKTAIYGAGLAGAGFAVGGIVEMAPHLRLAEWLSGMTGAVSGAVENANLPGAAQNASDAVLLALLAVAAGFTFLIAAMTAAQSR
jgi:hypothetical protein